MKKDTKWLKEEVNKTIRNKVGNGINYYDYLDLKNSLNEIIGQLDKQEAVENLFVPKQKDTEWLKEEVDKTLRNKIADVIHHCDYINLKNSLNEIINQLDEPELPMIPNEVEEEQKYVLLINITDKASKTNYETYLNKRGIFHSMENESFNKEDFNWSEEEIKDLENGEILFEHFAVKVEEVE